MAWIKHQVTLLTKNREVRRIYDEFGLGGYGLYWRLIELIQANDGSVKLNDIIRCSHKGLNAKAIIKITSKEYGLFITNDEGMVSLARESASDRASSQASDRASISASDRLPAVPFSDDLKNRIDIENLRYDNDNDDDNYNDDDDDNEKFRAKMFREYPRVMSMQKRITKEQFDKIVNKFGLECATDTIMRMENCPKLHRQYISAYLTLNNWCKSSKIR